mmetsp:Transcript_72110/g.143019  ORF Transcript_72110/g.143019 Transcript_72110/m.143019 type:complete len:843 (-) Transcript_72110:32-2560(-)|eukprot:CAMPEP_0174702978 /NCGR_PEP_ID=MMETSP1094-20130205/7083_1 /TAXON_ID=156173 /ORGANISM="Chrysochromulina brevifilum, Strain UTEX LB 985" /LENGTH=842 /DNA_ID=CAMNT_0015900835 /DNA_START=116 /DNA_END=2644 /DNA_ORIENTATION=+
MSRRQLSRQSTRGSLFNGGRLLTAQDDPEHELFRNLWRQKRLLPPFANQVHSRRLRKYAYVLFMLTLYESIYMPLQLAFLYPRIDNQFRMPVAQVVIQYLIDVIFMLDIYVRFHTMYTSAPEDGSELIMDRKLIANRYLRGAFVVDVLACFPIDIFAAGAAGGGLLSSTALALRTNRLLHLTRIYTVHRDQINTLGRLWRLVLIGSCFLLYGHLVACGWWAIGTSSFNQGQFNAGVPLLPWTQRIPGYAVVTHPTSSFTQQYWTSAYWALTVLVKVPWIGPSTSHEIVYAAFAVASGALFYAFICGEVTAIATAAVRRTLKKNELAKGLSQFKEQYPLPAIYFWEAVLWMRADNDFRSAYEGKDKLRQLPYNLRMEAALVMHREVLAKSPFSKSCTEDAVAEIALLLTPRVCMAGQTLIEQDQVNVYLYMVSSGSLKIFSAEKKRLQPKAIAHNVGRGGCPTPVPQQTIGTECSAAKGRTGLRARFQNLPGVGKKEDPLANFNPGLLNGGPAARPSKREDPLAHMACALPGMANMRAAAKARCSSGMKEMSRFRVCEKLGSMVGITDLDNEVSLFPFKVEATKFTTMYVISRKDLIASFSRMTLLDQQAVRASIKLEHEKHVNSLKVEMERRTSMRLTRGRNTMMSRADDDDWDDGHLGLRRETSGSHTHNGLPYDESMPMETQALLAATALRRVLEECGDEFSLMKRNTVVLPQLLKNAQGKVGQGGASGWGVGQAGQKRGGRRSILMAPGNEPLLNQRRPSICSRMTFFRGGNDSSRQSGRESSAQTDSPAGSPGGRGGSPSGSRPPGTPPGRRTSMIAAGAAAKAQLDAMARSVADLWA